MLRDTHAIGEQNQSSRNPPSPIRRLVQHPQSREVDIDSSPANGDFGGTRTPYQERSRIRRDAFSPNYFNTFFVEERELGRGGKGVVLLVRHEIDGCHLGMLPVTLGLKAYTGDYQCRKIEQRTAA